MNDASPLPRLAPCPICGKPALRAHRPFCSARCRSVDLSRWLHGVYRVETDEDPQSESDTGEAD